MLSAKDCSTDLLGLKDVSVTSVKEDAYALYVHIETKPKECTCPCCRTVTHYIHDYRLQKIRDLPLRGKYLYLLLKKRRYVCKHCGKRFFEKYSFLPRFHRMTQRVYENIIRSLYDSVSMKSVSSGFNVSTNTVSRVFDLVHRKLFKLPKVLSIDEFKGNAGGEKYQVILANPAQRRVLDILPTRYSTDLIEYFKSFQDRNIVEYVVMDMYSPYFEVCRAMFPKAKIIADKYHYIRQVYWALDRVRKLVQKGFVKEKRIYFKHSRKLLYAPYDSLSDEDKQALRIMLSQDFNLQEAWQLKEMFRDFRQCKSSDAGRKILRDWLLTAQECNIPEFKDCITAFTNWFKEILNSLDCPYTNGFTEGTNNKIKVLKRNAYGFRNFNRFRNRILHICS